MILYRRRHVVQGVLCFPLDLGFCLSMAFTFLAVCDLLVYHIFRVVSIGFDVLLSSHT